MCSFAFFVFIFKLYKYFDDNWNNTMNGNYVGQDNCDMKCSHRTMPNCHVGVKQTSSVGFRGVGIILLLWRRLDV